MQYTLWPDWFLWLMIQCKGLNLYPVSVDRGHSFWTERNLVAECAESRSFLQPKLFLQRTLINIGIVCVAVTDPDRKHLVSGAPDDQSTGMFSAQKGRMFSVVVGARKKQNWAVDIRPWIGTTSRFTCCRPVIMDNLDVSGEKNYRPDASSNWPFSS